MQKQEQICEQQIPALDQQLELVRAQSSQLDNSAVSETFAMLSQFEDFNERFIDEASLEAILIELYEADSENVKPVSSGIIVDTNFEGFC